MRRPDRPRVSGGQSLRRYAFRRRLVLRLDRQTIPRHRPHPLSRLEHRRDYYPRPLGRLFAKTFGFSFTVLRFSTLPLAAASVALCYLLARKAGLSAKSSLFVAMTLALSPVFLPLATSFMTDVPGLFFILFSLYCLVLACTTQRSSLWIILAVVASILGGMGRQVDWLVTLALLPYVAFLLRRRLRLVALCAIGWLLVVANAALTTAWFNHQPDVMIDRPFHQSLVQIVFEPAGVLIAFLKIALTTVLLALPAAIPFCLGVAQRTWRKSAAGSD